MARFGVIRYRPEAENKDGDHPAIIAGWWDDKDGAGTIFDSWRERFPDWEIAIVIEDEHS